MSELKTTPGPWTVFAPDGKSPGIEAEEACFSVVVFSTFDDNQGVQGETKEEAQANAHLIAAAPDLYAELKAAEKILEDVLVAPWRGVMPFEPEASKMRSDFEQMGRIRTALAKARGEGQS